MKDKSKKSTCSTTFGVDPPFSGGTKKDALKQTPMVDQ